MPKARVLFTDLNLIKPLQRAVAEAGYTQPTPIQLAAIPPALEGKDILGCAQTGTGKTAAFALPILQHVDETAGDSARIRALILTPTRELAAQISESLSTYGAELDLWHTVIFGGVNEKPQIRLLQRGIDILVATPGRLLDLMNRGYVNLEHVEIFVLDEADRMLDMGFIHDVTRICKKLPRKRQTLFFSATMPADIRKLADSLLTNPEFVSVDPISSTAERIGETVYFVDKNDKPKLLIEKLKAPECTRVLVFSRTKHGANRIVKTLDRVRIASAAIHGNKSQGARTRALEGFRNGELGVLVATDIAARGIDIDDVTHVINYDIPNIPETYVHRIGRTARAGREGLAFSFCESDERAFLEDIERLIERNIPRDTTHPFPPSDPVPPETDLVGRTRYHAKPKGQPGGRQSVGARPARDSAERRGRHGDNARAQNAGPTRRRQEAGAPRGRTVDGARARSGDVATGRQPEPARARNTEEGRPRRPSGRGAAPNPAPKPASPRTGTGGAFPPSRSAQNPAARPRRARG